MNKLILNAIIYSVLSTFTSVAWAEQSRQLGAHVHGAAKMDLVVEGQIIDINFESPAMNIVGFEHAPDNSEQRSVVEEAKKTLGMIASIIELPDQAGCILTHNSVEWAVENEQHEEGEEGDEDEEHSEDKEHASHSEFQAQYSLECKNAATIESLAVKLFDQYKGLEEIALQAVLPSGQTAMKLTPSLNIIYLR